MRDTSDGYLEIDRFTVYEPDKANRVEIQIDTSGGNDCEVVHLSQDELKEVIEYLQLQVRS